MNLSRRFGKWVPALLAASLIAGCATTNNPQDPHEGFNRAMFSFNETVDKVALKPAATVYQTILPEFVQNIIGNFFGNIGDVWIAVNNLMQGKVEDGLSDVSRVLINSSVGLGGLFDIASEAGLPKHNEDFGQTLGRWGVKSGSYLVLPFFGSSTVRDTVALPVDLFADPLAYKHPVHVRNWAYGLRLVDRRASALKAGDMLEEAALDKYEFVRDAYLQRRENQIHDNGASQSKPNYDEDEDEDTTDEPSPEEQP